MEYYAELAGMAFDEAFEAEAIRGTGSAPRCGTLRGETVVVSTELGTVGQLVGQIAKLAGCRAVAIAGGEDKLQRCREIGFDAGINYKKAYDLTAAVKEACPQRGRCLLRQHGGPYPRRGNEKPQHWSASSNMWSYCSCRSVRQARHWRAVHGPAHRVTRQCPRISGA